MWVIFIHIMASPVSDIFSIFVFNNIMGLTFIFSPRVFLLLDRRDSSNSFIFNRLHLFEILAHYR
jgi:hypothetical protein